MTPDLGDIFAAAGFFGALAEEFKSHNAELEAAAKIMEKTAKSLPGTYQDGWPALAESTLAKKQAGDSPLLETGEFRDSIKHNSSDDVAHVGTNDQRGPWFEFGTDKMPPRPVFGVAIIKAKDEIEAAVGKVTVERMLK